MSSTSLKYDYENPRRSIRENYDEFQDFARRLEADGLDEAAAIVRGVLEVIDDE